MRRKTVVAISVVFVGIFIVSYWILAHNSLSLALKHAGYDSLVQYIVELDVDANGREFTVFQTESKEGKIALVLATKNRMGFWYLKDVDEESEQVDVASLAWVEDSWWRKWPLQGYAETVYENEWHYAYSGNNAVNRIRFETGQLPDNCTVHTWQMGEFYIVYIVRVGEEPVQMNIVELLQENGCIAM